jgi:hypothetical protein
MLVESRYSIADRRAVTHSADHHEPGAGRPGDAGVCPHRYTYGPRLPEIGNVCGPVRRNANPTQYFPATWLSPGR